MTAPTALGEVIAERHLVLRAQGEAPRDVRVRIGRPLPMDAAGDACCPVEITVGASQPRLHAIAGVDAVQAIALALQQAELQLALLERNEGGLLEWPMGGRYRVLNNDTDGRGGGAEP